MSEKIHYFRVGLFTVFSLVLLTFGLILFGAGKIFKDDSILLETYFNQSVQGLDIGSPVKFNGVKVGEVKEILFAKDLYGKGEVSGEFEDYYKGVVVRFEVKGSYFPKFREEDAQAVLDKLVRDEGLRIRMNVIGITGLVYLEISFWSAAKVPPPMKMTWAPEHLYIPSAPSVITRLTDQLDKFLNMMDDSGYSMLGNLSRASNALPGITSKLNETLTYTTVVAKNLEDVTTNARKYPSQIIFGEEPPRSRYDR